MADNTVDFEFKGLGELRAELKAAQLDLINLGLAGKEGSDEFIKAAKKAGQLKEAVADAGDAAKAFTTQGKFEAVTKSLAAVSGGFNAIQSSITLVTGDSKLLKESLDKIQAVMALTQGLTALADAGDAFKNLKSLVTDFGKSAITALKGIKSGIAATGIGALVVALGALVAYWDDIKAAVSGVSSEQENLNKQSAENLAIEEANLAAISAQENSLKLQGATEEEIYDLKVQQYDQTIQAAKVNLANLETTAKAEREAAERNKENLQNLIRLVTLPITALLAGIDEVGKALGQDFGLEEGFSGGLAKLVFDPEETKKEGEKTVEEAKKQLIKLQNDRDGLVLAHNNKKKEEAKKAKEDAAKANQEELDKQKDHQKNIEKLKDQAYVDASTTEEQRKRRELEKQQEQQREELDELIKGYENKKKLTEAELKTLQVLRDEAAQLQIAQTAETAALEAEIKKDADEKAAEAAKQKHDEELAELKDADDKKTAQIENYYKDKETQLLKAGLSEKELQKAQDQLELERLKALQDATKTSYDERLKYLETYYADQEAKIKASGKTEAEIAKELEALNKERLKAQGDARTEYETKVVDLANQTAAKETEIDQKKKKEKEEMLQQGFDVAVQAATAVTGALQAINDAQMAQELAAAGDNNEKKEAIKKDYFEKNKKLSIAQATISTIQGAVDAFTGMLKIDPSGITGSIFAALALATGYANIAKIKATQYEGGGAKKEGAAKSAGSAYAEGGLLQGASHDLGGIKTSLGELEGGEFIVNKRATMDFLPLLNQINEQGRNNGPEMTSTPGQTQPIIKTYVVASEMTSQQEADAKLSSLARL